jgi:cytosine/adenosine deaminase-related metal-dependent hydrolase
VNDLGFTPAEALRAATAVTAGFMANARSVGALEPGCAADFIAVQGSPLKNVAILQDKARIRHVHIAGKRISVPPRGYDPRQVTDHAWTNWNDLYTQNRVVELGIQPDRHRLALQDS